MTASQRLHLEPQDIRELDTLPPFTALTTEEDWEKKAGHRAPGTYYVIANSASFPPSGDTTPTSSAPRPPLEGASSRRQSLLSISTEISDDSLGKRLSNIAIDENTVIVGSFDETARQSQSGSAVSSTLMLQLESGRYSPGSPLPGSFVQAQANLGLTGPASLPYPVGRYTQEDLRRRHYRTVVRRHMFSISGNTGSASPGEGDIFEQEVQNFPLVSAPPFLARGHTSTSGTGRRVCGRLNSPIGIHIAVVHLSRIRLLTIIIAGCCYRRACCLEFGREWRIAKF